MRRNLLGHRYHRLTVIGSPVRRGARRVWPCRCDCGNKCKVETYKLRSGWTKSCGCFEREMRGKSRITHGESRNGQIAPRLKMFLAAKARAKAKSLPFNISLDDIQIPETCPILGMPLISHEDKCDFDSPSLDRITPHLGYVKGNIQIISHKANTIKSNATLDELKAVTNYLQLQRERLSEQTPKPAKQ